MASKRARSSWVDWSDWNSGDWYTNSNGPGAEDVGESDCEDNAGVIAASSSTKRTTVTKTELTSYFSSKPGYAETYAPYGLSLKDQGLFIRNLFREPASRGPRTPAFEVGFNLSKAISLFREGRELPFIARYRKAVTGGMEEGHLRLLKRGIAVSDELERKRGSVTLLLEKKSLSASTGSNSKEDAAALKSNMKTILQSVSRAKTIEEIEEIYAPFKDGTTDKATQARSIGLEKAAELIIKGDEKGARYEIQRVSALNSKLSLEDVS